MWVVRTETYLEALNIWKAVEEEIYKNNNISCTPLINDERSCWRNQWEINDKKDGAARR